MYRSADTSPPLHIVRGINATTERLLPRARPPTAAKKGIQLRQRAWLKEIVNQSGETLLQVALKSGVSASTLSRVANSETYDGVLSAVTIERITEAYQVAGPDDYGAPRRQGLLGFSEAERYVPAANDGDIAPLVQALLGTRPGADAWRLKTEALEEVGYLPGDIVIVDLNAQPAPQDVVCAQVYDWRGGGAQTIWRVFDPPYLIGAARDRTAYKPLAVDNQQVVIKGVVEKMVRPHRRSSVR